MPPPGILIGRIRHHRAVRLAHFFRKGQLTFSEGFVNGDLNHIKRGEKAGRVEGFKIRGIVSTTMDPDDEEYNNLVLACGTKSCLASCTSPPCLND